ncbi:MAG: MATE family efflux transporter [Pseudomonadota bacterium]
MDIARHTRLLSELLRLGVPLLISMSAIVGLGVTDTIMSGLASTRDLAALAIGSAILLIPMMLLIGLLSVVAPRVSWHLGRNNHNDAAHDCWQAMWLGGVVGAVCAVVVLLLLPLLALLGLEPEVLVVAEDYLRIVVVMLPLFGVSLALRNTIDGLGFPVLNMWVSIGGLLLNALLDYLFVFGRLGIPQLGAVGCAVATVGVVTLQLAAPIAQSLIHKKIRAYRVLDRWHLPQWSGCKTLLLLGLPAAFAVTLEECFFSSTSLLVAPMGTNSLAAHQVVLNIAMLALIFPIAMGQAAAILIGRSLGNETPDQAAHQARFFLWVLFSMMLLCCLLMLSGRGLLMDLFTKDVIVKSIGAGLLLIVAFQLIVDGLQIGSNIALKGYQDTFVPAVCQMVAYWGVGFPLAYLLTRTTWAGEGGVERVWYALFAGLSVAAVLGVWRLFTVSDRFVKGTMQLKH